MDSVLAEDQVAAELIQAILLFILEVGEGHG
jgi:hypothetical protein